MCVVKIWLDEIADFHIDSLPTTAGKRQITDHSLAHLLIAHKPRVRNSIDPWIVRLLLETLVQAVMVETS